MRKMTVILFFILAAQLNATELSQNNLARLKALDHESLVTLKNVLLENSASLENYDAAVSGKRALKSKRVERETMAEIEKNINLLSDHLVSAKERLNLDLNIIQDKCLSHIDEERKVISKIPKFLKEGKSLFNKSRFIQYASMHLYKLYFFSLAYQARANEDIYIESLDASYPCIENQKDRLEILVLSTKIAQGIDGLILNEIGIPSYAEGEALSAKLIKINEEESSPYRKAGGVVADLGLAIGSYYLGVGILKTLYDVGSKGLLIYRLSFGAITGVSSSLEASESSLLNNLTYDDRKVLGPQTAMALQKMIVNSSKITLPNWIKFLSLVEDIQIEELSSQRENAIKVAKCNKQCSKEDIKKALEKNHRNLKEVSSVLNHND